MTICLSAQQVAEAVMHYTLHDPNVVLNAVYGDGHHESYMREKEAKLTRSGVFFFLHLDHTNRSRFVEAAIAHWGKRFDDGVGS